jgi:hypothetical protein
MSAGIADAGMRVLGRDRPTPLPVQALDHATGYLMAAAVLRGLFERAATGRGYEARASLARTAQLLVRAPADGGSPEPVRASEEDWSPTLEASGFGSLRRLKAPLSIAGVPLHWDRAASVLGSAAPAW